MQPNADSFRRRFLLGVFVVSGFTGLIYESIWSHYLKLFLGHAGYAQTLVLTIFMGGLAAGSWIVARYSGHSRRLLWGYLLVEGLTGLLGILFHPLFVAASDFSFATVIPHLPTVWSIDLYKWTLAALLILPQSILLGMTFPLLSGGIIRRWPQLPGQTLATLYFTNSLGAAVGVLVSGFVLIGRIGLPGTVLSAGLLNIVLALAVWLAVRGEEEPAPPATVAATPAGSGAASWFATAAFLTGAASFAYEIGWIRMLSLVLGSATHSFELMLSAFILGLALGGLYVRNRIDRIEDSNRYLGMVMIVMGALAALTLPAYNANFDFMAWAMGTFTHTASGYVAFNFASQFIAAATMIPTTFCAGMSLPLLTHALMRSGGGEQAIGRIYAWNTLGAIVGVVLTVHVLMPLLGLKGVILTGAVIHVALGAWRLLSLRPFQVRFAGGLVMAAGAAVLFVAAFVAKLDSARMVSGVYRTGYAVLPPPNVPLFVKDGKTATIGLVDSVGTGSISIVTNGKPDAAVNMGEDPRNTIDEYTMVLLAAVPLSIHPHPARIANIGFGSGMTASTLLMSPAVQRIDTIEIEPVMVEAARKGFGRRIHNVFEDPRSHIVFEDAKTFFAETRQPYDVIVSEPSNPWVSGVSSLFSEEFYARVVQHLAPDGVFVQWLQTYETDMTVVASIVKALSTQFHAYTFYNLYEGDILILATPAAAFESPDYSRLQSPELLAALQRIGVQSITDLHTRQLGNQDTLGQVLRAMPVPANSDFFPYVDLNAPRLRFMKAEANSLSRLSTLPFPFLEFFQKWPTRDATLKPSDRSFLSRDEGVRRSLAIRRAITEGALSDLDPKTVGALMTLDASPSQCASTDGNAAWLVSTRFVSDATAPYLTASELAPIWAKITSSPCYRAVLSETRMWADLFRATAARDAAEIARVGTALLQERPSRAKDELSYLTIAIALADIRMGDPAEASGLLQRQWKELDHSEPYGIPLSELLVISSTPTAKVAVR
jgi:spermidine synthase